MDNQLPRLGYRRRYHAQSTLNTLTLEFGFYEYEIDGKPYPKPHRQADFIVDGSGLGIVFDIETSRPWFGQTCFDRLPDHAGTMIDALLGLRAIKCGLTDDRFPLYLCHCGDLQCGVISCGIDRSDNLVRWRDMRFEEDDDEPPDNSTQIPSFEFYTSEYDLAVKTFAAKIA